MLHKLLSSLSRGNGFESIDASKRSTADLRNRRMMFDWDISTCDHLHLVAACMAG